MIQSARRSQTLGNLLERSARRRPEAIAICCGTVAWTYEQFESRVRRAAAGIASLGIGFGDRVAILSHNSHEFAVVRFAVARLGAVLVPINFMLKAAEIGYILEHSGARILFVDPALIEVGGEAARLTGSVERLIWIASEEPTTPPPDMQTLDSLLSSAESSQNPVDSRDLAQIIYTSGTESAPKGAMLTHEAVITQYLSCIIECEIGSDDTLLHSLPLYHCAQLDCFLGPGLYVGARNVITSRPTAENLLRLFSQYDVNSFFAPPTIWISILASPEFATSDLTKLAKGYYGASIMPVEVLRQIQRRLPQLRLWNLYGQTEMAPTATVLKPEDQLRKPGSAGRPTLHVESRVVDEQGRDVSPGQIGEIVHRSPQLFEGYWRDPERTALAFEGGWFHSGDLATRDDEGYLTIVDRKKDMIKTGGENVASREVEEVIYRHADVAEVAVIGVPHPKWIEAVVAVVVPRPGRNPSADAIISHCRESMAHFKVPKAVIFASALPKTPSGKVLKRELRTRHADGAERAV